MEAKNHQWKEATRMSWDNVKKLRERWKGPFILKGILSVEDAKKAVEIGIDGIVISNHGGRQLDCTPAPIDLLPDFVSALGNSMQIIVDSGFRRGTDILKALALGASGVMIGRPYLYGLAAGGEQGAIRAIEILKEELTRNMRLLGLPKLLDINSDFIRNNYDYNEKVSE